MCSTSFHRHAWASVSKENRLLCVHSAWGPAFVLTHHIPAGWPRPGSTVQFVTDGIEDAVKRAKAAAAGKSAGVHCVDTIQQLLNAGLLDELNVDVAAVLL